MDERCKKRHGPQLYEARLAERFTNDNVLHGIEHRRDIARIRGARNVCVHLFLGIAVPRLKLLL